MPDIRNRFHGQLSELETTVLTMGAEAGHLVSRAVEALARRDLDLAADVIAADDEIDGYYFAVHTRWLELVAEQQPMAGDLRQMIALLHVTTTLERMGDQAVNIAEIVKATHTLPARPDVLAQLEEMGRRVQPMVRIALECFSSRDVDGARSLVVMDDSIDALNEAVTESILGIGKDAGQLEYAIRMILAARALERIGDQAVDIGEQVVFMATGMVEEFNDARIPSGEAS